MVNNLITVSREEIEEARKRRMGLATPKQGLDTGSRPEAEAVVEDDRGIGGRTADAFRGFVPQSIRDLGSPIKRAFGFIDKPISQRLGFEGFEERAGPLDEIGTFVVEELTRPTNYLAALAGGPAASGLARAGRVGRAVSGFVAPVSRGNAVQRIAAEGLVSAGARGAGEAANEYLPEDTPTPVRIALGLGAGVLGGTAAARGVSGVSRGTIGRDLLNIAPQPVRATAQTPESVPRIGALLNAKPIETIGDNATVRDILKEARDLEATASFQQNRLNLGARNALNRVGKASKGADGNYYVKDANGAPQPLQDVLENPIRYTLTPGQQQAVGEYATLFKTVRDERATFGVEPLEADLVEGQNFVSRKAATNTKGEEITSRRAGSSLSGGGKDRSRVFEDPLEAIKEGVVYAHPLEAFDLYTARGLKKAADTHIQSLLVPFSESSAVRVPAGLRAQHDGLLQSLGSLKATLGRLDDRARHVIDAYINAAEPNMDELLVELDEIVVRGSGRNAGLDAPAVKAEIERVKGEIKALRPAWKEALQSSKATPSGRATVNMGAAPLLAGRDFDAADAKRITDFYTRGIGDSTQLAKAAGASRVVNTLITPIRATLDWSSTMNQLGVFAVSNPIKFVRNFLLAARDMIAPSQYERWVMEEGADAAAHSVAVLGSASRTSDFEFGSWLERIPVFKQAQRHFQILTTRNRIDIYNGFVDTAVKRGSALSDTDKDQIARGLNRLSGIATSRAGDAETLVEFAPNFMRSGIETFVAAATDGTLEGQIARQYLRNMVVAGQTAVFAAAVADGRDPTEVTSPLDVKALKRGEIRLNSNFGTVRFAGQDVSMYGRWDSLARLAVISMDSVVRSISEQDAMQLFDAIGYGLTSKGGPLASFLSNIAQDSTFSGNDPTSVAGIVEQLAPFTVSGWFEDWQSGQAASSVTASTAFNFFGAKARELTAFEQMDQAAQVVFQKPWDELTGEEKAGLEQAQPKLAERAQREQERRAKQGDIKAEARVQFEQIDAERVQNELQAYHAYQAGEMNTRTYGETLSRYAYRAAKEKDRTTKVLGAEYGEPEGVQAALSAWFDTFDAAEIAPDVVDFDTQEALESALFRRIEAGEFGDPVLARRMIEERRKPYHAPEVQAFFDKRDYVSDSGYYDTADSAFVRYAPVVARILGTTPGGYGDLLAAMNVAERTGDRRTFEQLKVVKSAIDKQVSTARQMLRLRDPALDEALIATGKATVPIRQQKGVGVSLS